MREGKQLPVSHNEREALSRFPFLPWQSNRTDGSLLLEYLQSQKGSARTESRISFLSIAVRGPAAPRVP